MNTLVAKRRTSLSRAFLKVARIEALTEQKFVCFYCFEPLTARAATADHKEATHVGGLDSKENIVAACNHCNGCKNHMSTKEFLKKIKTSNAIPFLLIRFRRTLWIRTHLASKHIIQAVGQKYLGP